MMTNTSKQTIAYKPLSPSRQEFRLLELQPAQSSHERVVCRLITVPLTEDLEFLALSSLYGDPSESETVLVNNRPVPITAHLAQALRHIRTVFFPTISKDQQRRSPVESRAPRWLLHLLRHVRTILPDPDLEGETPLRLWVDVLCVNQTDEGEKSNPVCSMSRIYRSAKMVVGWVGLKIETSDVGLAIMKEIDDAMPRNWGDPGDKQQHPENYSPQHEWAKKIQHNWQDTPDGTPSFYGDHWNGALDFIQRSYFQRRWILEEIAWAKFPTFLIGDTIVSWKQVLRLNRLMEEFKDNESDLFPADLRPAIHELPLDTVHALLDEFDRMRKLDLTLELDSTTSSEDPRSKATFSTHSS
jgi:hypothetical protein